jgi:hypothetical protein
VESDMTDTRNADLTFAGGDVMAYAAPLGTAPPTGFEVLTGPWINCGWLETSGYIFKLNETMKEIAAAGTLDPIRTIITAAGKTFQATFLEAVNPMVMALYDDVPMASVLPATGQTQAIYTLPEVPTDNRYAWVFDTFDGDKQLRNFAPNGKVTARGDDQAQQADVTSLQMTVTLYPDMIGGVRAALKKYVQYGAAPLTAFTS